MNYCSNSDSKFGQMQVVPYPFYCSFEWDVERYRDSCQARLSLWNHPEKLQEIVDLNNSPDIRRRREIRALLRALAACGSLLSFTHTITRRFAYSMITSANGKTNVETQHWEDVEVSFKRGVIRYVCILANPPPRSQSVMRAAPNFRLNATFQY